MLPVERTVRDFVMYLPSVRLTISGPVQLHRNPNIRNNAPGKREKKRLKLRKASENAWEKARLWETGC